MALRRSFAVFLTGAWLLPFRLASSVTLEKQCRESSKCAGIDSQDDAVSMLQVTLSHDDGRSSQQQYPGSHDPHNLMSHTESAAPGASTELLQTDRKQHPMLPRDIEQHGTTVGLATALKALSLRASDGGSLVVRRTELASTAKGDGKYPTLALHHASYGGGKILEAVFSPLPATIKGLNFAYAISYHVVNAIKRVDKSHGQTLEEFVKNVHDEINADTELRLPSPHMNKDLNMNAGVPGAVVERNSHAPVDQHIRMHMDVAQGKVKDLWRLSGRMDSRILGSATAQVAEEIVAEYKSLACAEFVGFLGQFLLNSFIVGTDYQTAGSVVKSSPGILVRATLQNQLVMTMSEHHAKPVKKKDLSDFVEAATHQEIRKWGSLLFDKINSIINEVDAPPEMFDADASIRKTLDDAGYLSQFSTTMQAFDQKDKPKIVFWDAAGTDTLKNRLLEVVSADAEQANLRKFQKKMEEDFDTVFHDAIDKPSCEANAGIVMAQGGQPIAPFLNSETHKVSVVAETLAEKGKHDLPVIFMSEGHILLVSACLKILAYFAS